MNRSIVVRTADATPLTSELASKLGVHFGNASAQHVHFVTHGGHLATQFYRAVRKLGCGCDAAPVLAMLLASGVDGSDSIC